MKLIADNKEATVLFTNMHSISNSTPVRSLYYAQA
jgi:hypothetical protein